MVEVSQEDIDAAEAHFAIYYPDTAWGFDALTELLARHRIAAHIAGMREAAGIARKCMKLISIGTPGTGPFTRDDQVVDEVTEIIETAITQRIATIETGDAHDR